MIGCSLTGGEAASARGGALPAEEEEAVREE